MTPGTSRFAPRSHLCSFLGAVTLLVSASIGTAREIVIDFQGVKDTERIGQYYNGRRGHLGSRGPAYGVVFTPDGNARVSTTVASGQSLLFANNINAGGLTPVTMNVAGGFSGQLSFQYGTPMEGGSVTIYDGLNGSGQTLATRPLPRQISEPVYDVSTTPVVVVTFSGRAKSAVFSLPGGATALDNIKLSK